MIKPAADSQLIALGFKAIWIDYIGVRTISDIKKNCRPTFANTCSTMLPLVLVKIFGWINLSTSSPTLNELSPGSTTAPENSTSGTAGIMGINYCDEDKLYP